MTDHVDLMVCIGGPLDGKVRNRDCGQYMDVPLFSGDYFSSTEPPRVDVARYVREQWRAPGRVFEFWRFDQMTLEDAALALLRRYALPR